jgi:hypothetical protein
MPKNSSERPLPVELALQSMRSGFECRLSVAAVVAVSAAIDSRFTRLCAVFDTRSVAEWSVIRSVRYGKPYCVSPSSCGPKPRGQGFPNPTFYPQYTRHERPSPDFRTADKNGR